MHSKSSLYSLFIFISIATVCLAAVGLNFQLPRLVKSVGYVDNKLSVIKINPQQSGFLLTLNVTDKSLVKAGQVLGEVTTERFSRSRFIEQDQALISAQKTKLIKDEVINIRDIQIANERVLIARTDSIKLELLKIAQELWLSEARVISFEEQVSRQKSLQTQGFVSIEAVDQKSSELAQQKISLSYLERNQLQLQRDLKALQEELPLIAARVQSQKSVLMRELASSEQEFNEHTSKRTQLVSPIDGVVTQISVSAGQSVRPELPILTIVPKDSAAEALLLIPSRSIGFIRMGQKVSVRYQSYPYEHYGRQYGIVKEIATAALPPQEIVQYIKVDEPVYTVRVSLPTNYLEYQGKQLPISPGMVLEADVELDRLKIYQWLLEPLYRLGGRL